MFNKELLLMNSLGGEKWYTIIPTMGAYGGTEWRVGYGNLLGNQFPGSSLEPTDIALPHVGNVSIIEMYTSDERMDGRRLSFNVRLDRAMTSNSVLLSFEFENGWTARLFFDINQQRAKERVTFFFASFENRPLRFKIKASVG